MIIAQVTPDQFLNALAYIFDVPLATQEKSFAATVRALHDEIQAGVHHGGVTSKLKKQKGVVVWILSLSDYATACLEVVKAEESNSIRSLYFSFSPDQDGRYPQMLQYIEAARLNVPYFPQDQLTALSVRHAHDPQAAFPGSA